MSSEPGNKAVFLSYASQDAEAARRICEALREAGVEVWFDQSELVGGDAWDAKIRKQIAECALFVPLISAATQARREGYFRLEWRLAAQRTHMMSESVAFLLPVVIDATRDTEADVPGEFKAVQWTRLPGGEKSEAFCARVKKLLGGPAMEPGRSRPGERGEGASPPVSAPTKEGRRFPAAVWLAASVAAMALAAFIALRPKPNPASETRTAVGEKQSMPLSEARKLVTQARTLFDDGDQSNHENFFLADDLLKRAQALDPTDGEIWAAQAQLSGRVYFYAFDRSGGRREAMRTQAERALKLSPESLEAQLAMASYLTFGGGPTTVGEAIQQLSQLAERAPQNRRVFWTLGSAYSIAGRIDDSATAFRRGHQIAGGDPEGLALLSGQLFYHGRYAEVEEVVAQALAVRPVGRALLMDVQIKLAWKGDLDGAAEAFARWPAWLRLEDRGGFVTSQLWMWRREPDKAIAALNALSQDFLNDSFFIGPKAGLMALAHEMAGRPQAARSEWERAREVAERVLVADTSNKRVLAWKAIALAKLGQPVEAEKILHELEQLRELRSDFWSTSANAALLRIVLGRGSEVPAKFDSDVRNSVIKNPVPSPRAALRLNPAFDPIRETPEFQKWLAAAPMPVGPGKSAMDEKSVAVLAFDNRSDDKEAEYFSDGISEELINALGRVPGLTVRGRTSAFFFKGKNATAREIGEKLDAAYLVRGSVRKAGGKVRITAQLSRAATDEVVWTSEPMERELKDIFAVQDEIVGLIAGNLEIKIAGRVGPAREIDPEAYQHYLSGRAAAAKAGMADLRQAVTHFDRALAREPAFAAAWVQLASAHTQLGRWGGTPTREAWPAARAAIDRARALEPESPDVFLALGWILRTAEWDWRGAEQAFRRAMSLRPHHPDTLAAASVLLFNVGKQEEAFRLGRQAAKLDPLNAATQIDLSLMFFFSENWREAEQAARRALQLSPASGYHAVLAWSLIAQKRTPEAEAELALDHSEVERFNALGLLALVRGEDALARAQLAKLEELARANPDKADLQQSIAWLCTGLGEKDRAFAALEKARASRDPSVAWSRTMWPLRPLYSDPRWGEFLRKIGLADDQLK